MNKRCIVFRNLLALESEYSDKACINSLFIHTSILPVKATVITTNLCFIENIIDGLIFLEPFYPSTKHLGVY